MRPTPLARRLVIPVLLVALVGWLAALQYHWLDEVSQADRNRRKTSLQQHATDFTTDFDRELSRLYVMLSSMDPSASPAAETAFGHRYDSWREGAADPQIVRAIYRASAAPAGATIRQFDPATRAFKKTEWPPALADIRTQLDRSAAHATGTSGATISLVSLPLRDVANPDIPAVIASIRTPPPQLSPGVNAYISLAASPDLMIAVLDRAYIETTWLPALAARYFPASASDTYRLAVIDSRHADAAVMTENWQATAVDVDHADASEPLFQLRPEITAQFIQRSFITLTPGTNGRQGAGGAIGSAAGGGVQPAPGVSVGAIARTAESSTFQLSVETRPDDAKASAGRGEVSTVGGAVRNSLTAAPSVNTLRVTTRPYAAWRLVLQHASGSLDAAVNRARARNLWLSFGLLAVLAAGIVLIVTNAQRSERLATQQMDFVATVSHELRTPLAVIRSAAQNLSAGVIEDPERARQYGALIDAEGRRLTEMVEQVLDYAGIAAARPDTSRPVDLGHIVADVAESCAPLATGAGVHLETGIAADLPAVAGDPQALRSAIQNLVTNALKYGADGGWVGIDVRSGRSGAKPAVFVTVRDRGLGIDAEDRRHLFEPFYRGRRAIDAQVRGNGLGLSLVKRIAEAHGGRVALESEPGAGAAFSLSIPVAAMPAIESSLIDARASAE